MKNKLKMIMLGVLCAVCLQAPVTAHAVDLPFVPVDDSETDTVTTAVTGDDTPIVTEDQTSATSAAVTTSKPTTTTADEKTTTKNAVSSSDNAVTDEPAVMSTDSENNNLPVISPDGEMIETVVTTAITTKEPSAVSENSNDTENKDISFSDDSNSSEVQATAHADNIERSETNESRSFPIIITVICGVAVIAGGALFAIFKKGRK